MIVVSDTSPLSNLFIIQKLDILKQLYGKVVVPEAVMNELLELEKRGFDLSPVKNAEWINVVAVSHKQELSALLTQLDLGEAEAIVLATELNADWLLMDEAKGRNIAKLQGLHIVGLLGVLLLAKEKGLVAGIKSLMDDLIGKAKFRISDELYQKVISAAGEE
jgi:predicted nucleic acid-binding protein